MPRERPEPTDILEVYIDESSQTNHRYFGLGALAINHTQLAALESRISYARLPELPAFELGWTKVSRTKLDAYKRIVDVLFERRMDTQPMHFHMLVVDAHKLKDRIYNGGSREVGFNKEVYQLCHRLGRLYKSRVFHAYLDNRTTSAPIEELRSIVNFGFRKKGHPRIWPFRRIHFRESADSLPIQLCDIVLGAVMYRVNGHHKLPDASPAKTALSEYVINRMGVTNPMRSTSYTGRYTIWHRQLR